MATDMLEFGGVSAPRGSRSHGFLKIGETPVGPINLPLVVINGAEPGPTLCLTAGVHAAEYPAIDAVMRTVQSIDPRGLRGAVVAVPVVNTLMFQNRSGFLNPVDGLNLNRTAPGTPEGSISEILAHRLLEEVIGRAEYHIDCHGGDLGEILWPYAGYALTGNADLDLQGEMMIRLYSPRIIALYDEQTALAPTAGSLTYAATRRGVVSMLAEAGSNGELAEADVQTHLRGIRNVMRYLRMIPGTPRHPGEQLRARDQFIVRAGRGGLVRLKIGIGDEIEEGQEIAEIIDLFGDVAERVHAGRAGIARLIWAAKAVNTGDPIVKCWVGEPAGVPPLAAGA